MSKDPFVLFCLYYLGLTPQGEYKFVNANQVAGLLHLTVAELMKALGSHGIHPDTVVNTDFPLARHQVDIQIAAETESPAELSARATQIFEAFQGQRGKKRDWLAEIQAEQKIDPGAGEG